MKLTSFFTKRSLAVFFINTIAAFLMAVIPHLNLSANFVSPSASKQKLDIFETISPKLEFKKNNFEFKKALIPQVSAGTDYEEASAYGVINLDTGEILASKNFSKALPIASITKVMTVIVALDLAQVDEKFSVSEKAALQIPTKVALKAGEKYPLKELIEHSLISSANDSAQVIKEGIDQKYGEEVFIKAMNEKAKFLGLKNTHFTTPQGFDNKEHFSSVEDLGILSHYAIENYPFIVSIVDKDIIDLTEGWSDRRFYLQNWNGLIGVYPGTRGLKIGNTDQAGHCTVVFAEREGKKVLAIVLGAPGVLERDFWASELLDLGFEKLKVKPAGITEDQLKLKYSEWKYFR